MVVKTVMSGSESGTKVAEGVFRKEAVSAETVAGKLEPTTFMHTYTLLPYSDCSSLQKPGYLIWFIGAGGLVGVVVADERTVWLGPHDSLSVAVDQEVDLKNTSNKKTTVQVVYVKKC